MQRPNDAGIQSPSGDRVLNLGTVRIHNRHLQSGLATRGTCPVCTGGLESVLEEIAPKPVAEPEVVESDGGDQADDAPPPFDRWAY